MLIIYLAKNWQKEKINKIEIIPKTRNSQCINTKFKIKMKNILFLTAIHIRKNVYENFHELDLNHWF